MEDLYNFKSTVLKSEVEMSEIDKVIFKNFDFEEYCSPEKKIIPKIFEFCQKNNLKFKIISSYKSDQPECILEKEFFEKILESSDWEMTINKKKDRLSAYEILSSEAEFVAHIDSTLGYECL